MNLQKIKVYHLFWIISLFVLLIALIQTNYPNSTLDINIHDTYFVIANYHFAIILFASYFLMGAGYWFIQKIFKKNLVKSLTLTHSVILIGSFILYWIIVIYEKLHLNNRTYEYFDDSELINITLVIELLLILFIATPIYIINLSIGLFRKNG